MENAVHEINWEDSKSHLLLNPNLTESEKKIYQTIYQERSDLGKMIWIASSGSSQNSPKMIGLTKKAVLASAQGVNQFFQLTSSDRWALLLPTWHVGGLGILARAHLTGSECLQLAFQKWNATAAAKWMREVEPTAVSLVPTQLFDLVQAGEKPPSSLRWALLGGAALEQPLKMKAVELGWPVIATFGMSEGASMIAAERELSSSVLPMQLLPHWNARTSRDGFLELRGEALFTCYGQIMDPQHPQKIHWVERTEAWWKTSDRVNVIPNDFNSAELQWMGREDEFVKIKGEGVYISHLKSDLDRYLQSKPEVSASLIGIFYVHDDRAGNILVAAFAGKSEESETLSRVLNQFNENRLSHEKIHQQVVHSQWPRTELGKVRKMEALKIIEKSLSKRR